MLFLPNHTPKLQEITREKVANLAKLCLTTRSGLSLRNRVCSITIATCLFHSQTKRYTMNYRFYIGYAYRSIIVFSFFWHVINKNENIINVGYWLIFWKSQKLIRSKKKTNKQSVLIAKISSRKTQKVTNPQKYTFAKISCQKVASVGDSTSLSTTNCGYLFAGEN